MLNLCGKNPLHSSWIPKVAGKLARENGRKHKESLKVNQSDVRDKILVPTVILVRDFSMRGVTMLEYEHAIIAFEVVEEDNDVLIVPVLVQG